MSATRLASVRVAKIARNAGQPGVGAIAGLNDRHGLARDSSHGYRRGGRRRSSKCRLRYRYAFALLAIDAHLVAALRYSTRHLGKFLRQAPRLIPSEKRRSSVAPPIEVGEGPTACIRNDEFAGGFGNSPRCPKTRQHMCRVHFCRPSPVNVSIDMWGS
jgi:hypothetical protein